MGRGNKNNKNKGKGVIVDYFISIFTQFLTYVWNKLRFLRGLIWLILTSMRRVVRRVLSFVRGVVLGLLRYVRGEVCRLLRFVGGVVWLPMAFAGRVTWCPLRFAGGVILRLLAFAGKIHGARGKPRKNVNVVEGNSADSSNHSFGNQVVSRENGIQIRGVEGSNNSCYMDSSLNSMFLFNEEFIRVLRKKVDPQQDQVFGAVVTITKSRSKKVKNDQPLDEETLNETLREKIAKPLKTKKSLRLSEGAMSEFRSHLSTYKKSYSWDQMDSEEFISTLFGTILKATGFYFIDGDSEGSYVFQTYADMTLPTNETDVQSLLEYSFEDSDIQLASIPSPGFIIKMPVTDGRHMFKKIYPNPTINLGKLVKNESGLEPEMILSAVICLSSHHYTTFVREGKDKNSSSWWYLDSFSHSNAEPIHNLDKSLEELRCSQKEQRLKFLIENCYMCFYSPVHSESVQGSEIQDFEN